MDGWAIVERLLTDLARLDKRVWLVVDDVHALATLLAICAGFARASRGLMIIPDALRSSR